MDNTIKLNTSKGEIEVTPSQVKYVSQVHGNNSWFYIELVDDDGIYIITAPLIADNVQLQLRKKLGWA